MRPLCLSLLLATAAAAQPAPDAVDGAPPEAAPIAYASPATGLRVVLPAGWAGVGTADEEALPSRATYRWEATSGPLAGAVLVIERAMGLNPLLQERWTRGQVAAGYYGLRPSGPLPPDARQMGPGAAFQIGAAGRSGRAYFAQRGASYWAVHVAAPARVLAARTGLLDEVVGGVRLGAASAETAEVAE